LPISVEAGDLWQNIALEARSREWNLTPYDAAYLDLALRESVPLATMDTGLEKVALAEGVRVLSK
jgi:predicted nucleic acid-binding protein